MERMQEEYNQLLEHAPLRVYHSLNATYLPLITPLTTLFTLTLGSLGSLIKRNLNRKYVLRAPCV